MAFSARKSQMWDSGKAVWFVTMDGIAIPTDPSEPSVRMGFFRRKDALPYVSALNEGRMTIEQFQAELQASRKSHAEHAEKNKPEFTFSPWRHGGWYVHEVHYASGAIGCVSNNFPDGKWRIVCHPAPFKDQPTFSTRLEAARAEMALAATSHQVKA